MDLSHTLPMFCCKTTVLRNHMKTKILDEFCLSMYHVKALNEILAMSRGKSNVTIGGPENRTLSERRCDDDRKNTILRIRYFK